MTFISSTTKLFQYYKSLGEKTMAQLPDEALFWRSDEGANSIAIIVGHLWGNMRSRWTDFLTSDGEKSWRERDLEFEPMIRSRAELLERWEEGWSCLFTALEPLEEEDMRRTIYIRNEGHSVIEAIQRQLAHYAYHVGQMVFLGRQLRGAEWTSLSIPRGESKTFNQTKFAREKQQRHFTDEG